LKIDVEKESESTITPLVELGNDFISSKPTWSRHPANKSTACPLFEARLARPSKNYKQVRIEQLKDWWTYFGSALEVLYAIPVDVVM
jgi:hypothetical protein